MLRLICFCALFSVALAGQIIVGTCPSGESAASNVRLFSPQFPDGTSSVVLKKTVTYDLEIRFVGSKAFPSLTTRIFGVIAGIPLPFPGIDPDTCKTLTPTCPIGAGREHVYRATLRVEPDYPSASLFIKWTMVNTENKDEVCIYLPARIEA